jgi:JmjC domain
MKMVRSLATLPDLLAPLSLSDFLEEFRGRRRLHISATDPSRAETLLSWRDIDTLLSAHGLGENVSVWRDGVLVPRRFYGSNEGRTLKVRALHDLLAQGASIVVDEIHHSIPQISQLAAAIEREMAIKTQVNAYLSFSKGGALSPHWDIHDVLVVQVHGRKQWRFWKSVVDHPVEFADDLAIDANTAPDHEIKLAPGDVLFIPRGEPHAAAVLAGRSVHLTIGLRSETGIDFFAYIQKKAAQDVLFRMDLPRHTTHEHSDAHEAALKQRLHQLIDATSMWRFMHEGDIARSPAVQTTVSGIVPQMEDVLRLTLRRRVPLPDVRKGEPQLVTIGGEARRLLPASVDALRWLFDHDPATLRALHASLTPHHEQSSIESALHELTRFGFLVVDRA